MELGGAVKVLFLACREELAAGFIAETARILPEIPLVIVSEFPRAEGEWIPWHPLRAPADNLRLIRDRLAGRTVRISATPFVGPAHPVYRAMRSAAFRLSPRYFLVFNRHGGHAMLRPSSVPVFARHFRWVAREFVSRQSHPGGTLYTWMWRFRHPAAWRRPLFYRLALLAGAVTAWLKRVGPKAPPPQGGAPLPEGISVVIPSRNGRELLHRFLPGVSAAVEGMPAEIIVVDNGSNDGTSAWLAREHPRVVVEVSSEPLSFARAVNRGAAKARFSHVCLLNNDMSVEPAFLRELRAAFDRVPSLFCATAQIFFPPGRRREETGKAVYTQATAGTASFPVRCDEPLPGENGTWVLYGSGGCSLFDLRRWRALGGMGEIFEPAYVEDLDLGFRAWRLGWPTVFVAGARVTHHHRATTSRYFDEGQIRAMIERNFLRFAAHAVTSPSLFRAIWKSAVFRVNLLAREDEFCLRALRDSALAPAWIRPLPAASFAEDEILALGNGDVSVFPGLPPRGRPVVLIVSPYPPFPLSHGGAVRMFNLLRRAARDFDQVLVCFTDELAAPAPELLAVCSELVLVRRTGSHAIPDRGRPDVVEEFDRASFHAVLRQTVRKWGPAIAQLEFTQMAQYAPACAPARTVLVEHDITFDLYAQLVERNPDWETRRQHGRWVRWEQAAWGQVDRVVTMSEKDRATVGRPHARVLPNGVDLQRFRPAATPPEPRRILFIGAFAHLPNLLGIDWFLRNAWPLLEPLAPVLHVIAGSRPDFFLERHRRWVEPPLRQPRVEVEAFVEDVREAYRRATVVVAPLLASAGTNIKIMEAMAMGKAIVSTPAGINGLDRLTPGQDVVVVDNAPDMAAAIAALLDEPATRRALEQEARRTVERVYGWDAIAESQRQLYADLLSEPK